MQFTEDFYTRILPYELLDEVYTALKDGTIFSCVPLGSFFNSKGIEITVRRDMNYINGSNRAFYKISNDERRRLMKLYQSLRLVSE